ncbi:MAG: hypothetical protein UX70_C0001G0739 [Candidatus Wolfebacteria bacterium GW2011_GWB1_47_1]|uniref:Uncharacterized protein n=1 Tax=Candidatus Wolfebacteria bacterium GW2011_GWB1_47_1 TaxID=1619007 RepID=A0A0G4AT00_9BACT|nr:MAG: hypothetical protein UX70_C0001G0739 [Candidatus Wolfebacteria bacterium GW2011_GWB1_47_1]
MESVKQLHKRGVTINQGHILLSRVDPLADGEVEKSVLLYVIPAEAGMCSTSIHRK